jgi:hypothetical protein
MHLPITPVDNERLGSDIQTLKTPQLMFRALLAKDGAQRLELARTWRSSSCTYALSEACSCGTAMYCRWPHGDD